MGVAASVPNGDASSPKLRTRNRRITTINSQNIQSYTNEQMNGKTDIDADVPLGMNGFSEGSLDTLKCAHPAIVNYCAYTKQGFSPYSKKPNQDSLLLFHDQETDSLMFGTLDGHGKDGHQVSQFIAKRMPAAVFRHPAYATDKKLAIREAIASVERQCLQQSGIDCELSGTTFVMGILQKNKLLVANIGDSRIIAGVRSSDGGTEKILAEPYSEDHKPDLPKESERILAAGGRVFALTYEDGVEGPPRVWLGNVDLPGIAMSRSLGDTVAHTAGVSSEPEFTEFQLTEDVECLIIATDGLWEFLSNMEVVQLWEAANKDPTVAMQAMIDLSQRKWMTEEGVVDDTTIIIANIDGLAASKLSTASQ